MFLHKTTPNGGVQNQRRYRSVKGIRLDIFWCKNLFIALHLKINSKLFDSLYSRKRTNNFNQK